MRKIIFSSAIAILFILAIVLVSLSSCTQAGKVRDGELKMIIHGKEWKFMRVVPASGHDPIWIMYPADSTGKEPVIVNGTNQTIIIN